MRQEGLPQNSQASPTIKNQAFTTHAHFHTRCVAAIAYRVWPWTWDTTSDAPEVNRKLVLHTRHGCCSLSFLKQSLIKVLHLRPFVQSDPSAAYEALSMLLYHHFDCSPVFSKDMVVTGQPSHDGCSRRTKPDMASIPPNC